MVDATAERFEKFVIPEPNSGCFLWIGPVTSRGYGTLTIGGKTHRAHRVAWELQHGAIPTGMMVLHACDNPPCVNTRHLHLGDMTLNMREMSDRKRSYSQKRTHCINGHPYSSETPIRRGRRGRRAHRECRICIRAKWRADWHKKAKRAARGGSE